MLWLFKYLRQCYCQYQGSHAVYTGRWGVSCGEHHYARREEKQLSSWDINASQLEVEWSTLVQVSLQIRLWSSVIPIRTIWFWGNVKWVTESGYIWCPKRLKRGRRRHLSALTLDQILKSWIWFRLSLVLLNVAKWRFTHQFKQVAQHKWTEISYLHPLLVLLFSWYLKINSYLS